MCNKAQLQQILSSSTWKTCIKINSTARFLTQNHDVKIWLNTLHKPMLHGKQGHWSVRIVSNKIPDWKYLLQNISFQVKRIQVHKNNVPVTCSRKVSVCVLQAQNFYKWRSAIIKGHCLWPNWLYKKNIHIPCLINKLIISEPVYFSFTKLQTIYHGPTDLTGGTCQELYLTIHPLCISHVTSHEQNISASLTDKPLFIH